MSEAKITTLSLSRLLLTIARWLNLLTGIGLVVAFVATFPFEQTFLTFFTKRPAEADPEMLIWTLRTWMILTLPMIGAVHIMLTRLLAIVGTVRAGDPFVAANAVRLKTIAWCLLAIELLRLVFGVMARMMNAAGSNIDWNLSLGGWIAVLLVFVLARVFAEGTRMRSDLEAMI